MLESLEGKRGMVRFKPPLPAHQGPVRQADRHQQRDLARRRADHPRKGARPIATTAWAARAARCRSSSPATSSAAAWSRRPSASRCASSIEDTAAAPRRAARSAPCRSAARSAPIFPTSHARHAAGLRGVRGREGAWSATAASWCSTTRVDMAQAGALRDGVLRHRKLRQVHALPHRLDARRRGDRPDHRRARPDGEHRAARRPLLTLMTDGRSARMGGLTPMPGA